MAGRLVIMGRDSAHKYSVYDYDNNKSTVWSEATFLKYYNNGEQFYQVGQCMYEQEMAGCGAIKGTENYNTDYGCWQFLMKADVKMYFATRKQYIFFKENKYSGQAEYYCRRGITSNIMGDAKIFDESDVYAQIKVFEKARIPYRVQAISC
jgi:hypothetical protein